MSDIPTIRTLSQEAEVSPSNFLAQLQEIVKSESISGESRLISVEGNFGPSYYEDGDIYYGGEQEARDVLYGRYRDKESLHKHLLEDVTSTFLEGSENLDAEGVKVMLEALDVLTEKGTLSGVNITKIPTLGDDAESEGIEGQNIHLASCEVIPNHLDTREERLNYWYALKLSGDNFSNPRATALADVLEVRWNIRS